MRAEEPPKKRGRPSVDADGQPSTRITLRLSSQTHARLRDAARTLRMTAQDVVRLAIQRNFDAKN